MLRQSLAALFGDSTAAIAALESAGVPQTARGEELDVAAFTALGRALDPARVPVRGGAVPTATGAEDDGESADEDADEAVDESAPAADERGSATL